MLNRDIRRWFALAVFTYASVVAQNNRGPMTDSEVVKMTKAGVSENILTHAIQTAACDFDLSADALVELKAQGVADGTVAAMQICESGANKFVAVSTGHVVDKRSALHGVAVESRMVTLSEAKQRYRGAVKRDNDFPSLAWQFGWRKVVVSAVAEGSPAAKAGVRPGDLVRQVIFPGASAEESDVHNEEDFLRLSSQCAPDCLILVTHPGGSEGNGWLLIGPQEHFRLDVNSFGCGFYLDRKIGKGGYQADLGETRARACLQAMEAYNRNTQETLDRLAQQRQSSQASSAQPNQQALLAPNSQATLGNDDIQQEIQKIRLGPHDAMPPAQQSTMALGGQSGMSVENGTQYTLFVFLSGPSNQKLEIPAGGSQVVRLLPGKYEVAARVSNPSVIPYYGEQEYPANTQALQHFYIAPR